MAYADYNDLIAMTEELVSQMVLRINGSYIVRHHPDPEGEPDKVLEINFKPPFKRVSMLEELERILKVEFPKDLTTPETTKYFDDLCKKLKVDCATPRTTARLLDKLVGEFIECDCLNPTFITEHP